MLPWLQATSIANGSSSTKATLSLSLPWLQTEFSDGGHLPSDIRSLRQHDATRVTTDQRSHISQHVSRGAHLHSPPSFTSLRIPSFRKHLYLPSLQLQLLALLWINCFLRIRGLILKGGDSSRKAFVQWCISPHFRNKSRMPPLFSFASECHCGS